MKLYPEFKSREIIRIICFFFSSKSSWGGEGNALPEGLIYEGISDKPIEVGFSNTFKLADIYLFMTRLLVWVYEINTNAWYLVKEN